MGKFFMFTLGLITLVALSSATSVDNEDLLVEVHSEVGALKKKGATEKDCKDLAKRTCKEVLQSVAVSQKTMFKVPSGSSCDRLGKNQVMKAKFEETKMKKLVIKWTGLVKTRYNAKVTISKQRYKDLKPGRCGFIFGSRSYLTARASWQRVSKQLTMYKARWMESRKMTVYWIRRSLYLQSTCRCNAKKRRNALFKVLSSKKTYAVRSKTYAKCQMMQCVLDGTPLKSKKCRKLLPTIKSKKLSFKTEKQPCFKLKAPKIPVRRIKRIKLSLKGRL